MYADDTQLYIPLRIGESKEAIENLEACIQEIEGWMKQNFLKLNNENHLKYPLTHQHKTLLKWFLDLRWHLAKSHYPAPHEPYPFGTTLKIENKML